jgi:hypothetical protein
MSNVSEISFWLSVGTFLIVLVGAIYGLYIWCKRRKERKKYDEIMEDPLEIHFLIPTVEKYKINYEMQHTEERFKDELEIPANFEDVIFIWIKPRIDIEVRNRYFGFEGREKKPIVEYFEAFVTESSISKNWYRDWHGYYHLIDESIWLKEEVYVSTFKIKTYGQGDYVFQAIFHLSCREWKNIKEERHKVFTKKLKIKIIKEKTT